jgi:hypothetical protein
VVEDGEQAKQITQSMLRNSTLVGIDACKSPFFSVPFNLNCDELITGNGR